MIFRYKDNIVNYYLSNSIYNLLLLLYYYYVFTIFIYYYYKLTIVL